jgi:hypothetical protein
MVKTTGPAPFAHFVIYEGNRSKSTVVLLTSDQLSNKENWQNKAPFLDKYPILFFSIPPHLIGISQVKSIDKR